MQSSKFNCIVDSAHGSSAKGAASTRLVDIYKVPNVSSCNYPNAGHTATQDGVKFVAKALPTPAFLNAIGKGKPKLWLGPGSGFFEEQLAKELKETGYSVDDIRMHARAVMVTERHIAMEAPGGLQSTEYISSTMSGSGAAYAEKAMRRPEARLMCSSESPVVRQFMLQPTAFMKAVRNELAGGHTFMHEVSQGFALSVNHGTHYPTCTFRDCTAQQAYADFSLLPSMIGDVYLNVRSFPIRVGSNFRDGKQVGYSGDFCNDQEETTWEKIAADAEFPPEEAAQLAERERTTVTKKIRRVATQSWSLLRDSAEAVGATKLILNFPQYIHYSAYKVRGGHEALPKLHPDVRAYIEKMENVTGLPVVMIGTSAEHNDYIWLG
jgi:adenylosuccinate synthase